MTLFDQIRELRKNRRDIREKIRKEKRHEEECQKAEVVRDKLKRSFYTVERAIAQHATNDQLISMKLYP